MYTSLSIQDFRGIHTLEMNDFRRVNILTGKNNCGKTSVLEAIYLLSRSDNPGVAAHFGAYRRFEVLDESYWWSLFYNFGKQIGIAGTLQGEVEKSLALMPLRTIDASTISLGDDWQKTVREMIVNPEAVTGVHAVYNYKVTTTQTQLHSKFSIGARLDNPKELEIKWEEPTAIVPPIPSTLFIHPAYLTDAPKRFSTLEVRKETDYLVQSLRYLEPAIQYIRLIDETFYCDIDKKHLLPLYVMGDGMVRLFSIILAIASTPGGVVLIDEIDTGFHYSSLEVMWKAVYEAAEQFDVQIFATTHSYECLRALGQFLQEREKARVEKPDQEKIKEDTRLYRLDKREDGHKAVMFDQELLESALERYWEVR